MDPHKRPLVRLDRHRVPCDAPTAAELHHQEGSVARFVATWEGKVLCAIHDPGLDLRITFNKDVAIVRLVGVDKASGFRADERSRCVTGGS